MSESTLTEFPKVPVPGTITAAEYGAKLISIPSDPEDPVDGSKFCDKIVDYHKINGKNLKPLFQHKIPPVRTTTLPKMLLVSKDQGVVKGMWDACRDSGWRGLQQYLKQVEKSPVVNVLYGCLSALTSITDGVYKLKYETSVLFFPHLALETGVIIQQASQVKNWSKAWVKAFAWNPQLPKLALALHDDSIRICTVGEDIMPLLRFTDQKDVSCIAWRPFVVRQIAVGVSSGIVLWTLQSLSSIKPGGCRAELLTIRNHAPVTSLEYSKDGRLLVSSSSCDTSIYIWDACTMGDSTPAALHRFGGGGVPFVSWSPFDDKILATSPSSLFRIWNGMKNWKPRRWNTPKDPIECACWTPDGSSLLFASGGMIYALHFVINEIEKFVNRRDCVAAPLYDVSECFVFSEDDKLEYKVGGRVRKMDIDPSGSRLAVFFDESELIAIFRVQPRSMYYLAPLGFIRGFPDEYPITIAFQRDYKNGALLTIAWSTGRLQYFPFLFAETSTKKNLLHEEYYRVPTGMPTRTSTSPKEKEESSLGWSLPASKSRPSTSTSAREDQDVFFPNASFASNYFTDPPMSKDLIDFGAESSEPPRLFSISQRSPSSTF